MHDIKAIRENPNGFIQAMIERGVSDAPTIVASILGYDQRRRETITASQFIKEEKGKLSKEIGLLYKNTDNDHDPSILALKDRVLELAESLQSYGAMLLEAEDGLKYELSRLPNVAAEDVPVGVDETGNVQVGLWRRPRAIPAPVLDHVAIGETMGMDFLSAVKMSGSRFVLLRKDIARLERAIGQFMLDLHTQEHGYEEMSVPLLVKPEAMFGTGQLPKFELDLFKTEEHYLIPTAEVSLTNVVRNLLMPEDQLPQALTALTMCFRAEVGSAGRDTRGMIRQHQFQKCELVWIVTPDQAYEAFDKMQKHAETVLELLELPYRKMKLCSGDMGFSARTTYDLEVWLPSEGGYREISSLSYCGDFQARRLNARYKPKDGGDYAYVHTLNGSGLAVGRTLVAILENFQNPDGSVEIPYVLHSYMGGLTQLKPVS